MVGLSLSTFNRDGRFKMNLLPMARLAGVGGGQVMYNPAEGSCSDGKVLAPECVWEYGSTENMLWEGVNATAELAAGPAEIVLLIDNTTSAATRPSTVKVDGGTADAARNLDALLLTLNSTDITSRATAFETGFLSLPLDGLLTQAGISGCGSFFSRDKCKRFHGLLNHKELSLDSCALSQAKYISGSPTLDRGTSR
jgi:hypothetical protein